MPEPKSSLLFATKSDLKPGLEIIEQSRTLQYALKGSFALDQVVSYASVFDIPNLGLSNSENSRINPTYLVMNASLPVITRTVPQRRGGMRYLIDQTGNPSAILFTPGGLYGDECIVLTEVMGTSDPESSELYRFFISKLTRGFVRIGRYRVGPEALAFSAQGKRLTHDVAWDLDYDLKVPKPARTADEPGVSAKSSG